jgi:glycine oxidase
MAIPTTLRNNETADVIIIGGGVIGLSVARALALRGVSDVLLLDRAGFGGESSSAAGGMLAPQAEADCADAFFQLACQSRDSYPVFAASLLEETGTDIELDTSGTLYLAFSEVDERELERRFEWQTRAPLSRVNCCRNSSAWPAISGNVRSALRFPLDIQVENRRLLTPLVAAAENGVRLITGLNVEKVLLQRGRVTG